MMDNLRAAANHVALKVILVLIILTFVLTGVSNYLVGGSGDYAAKVNGQIISRQQLEQAVQRQRALMQEQMGEQFSVLAGNEAYMKQLRQQSLSNLIDVTLLEQYAKKLAITITDQQIKEAILATPAFQTDNHFDNQKYLQTLRSMGYSPDYYASRMRQQLTSMQLAKVYGESDFTLPQEVTSLSQLVSQERDVRTLTLNTSNYAGKQQATDAELQSFYDQNKSSFVSPEQVKVSYIEMDAAAMESNIVVTDSDISAYYDQHKSEFGQPERRRYRVIVLKNEQDANNVAQQLKQGADFVALAKAKSTDKLSGQKGGDMGWMEPETTLPEFTSAGLKSKGQTSGVIKSANGYFILRLDDIQPEQIKPLADVRTQVASKIRQGKTQDAYYALQQKIGDAASNDNESLASAEQVSGLKSVHTDWFNQQSVPAALNFPPLMRVMFDGSLIGQNGTPGSNSTVINVDGDRAFVLRIDGHKKQSIKAFADVKDQLTQLVKNKKAEEQARIDGQKLLVALQQGKGDEALKAANLNFGDVQKIQRTQQASEFERTVYSMPHPQGDKPSYSLSADDKGNTLLIALTAVVAGKLPDNAMAEFSHELKQSSGNVTFDSLIASLRQQATVKYGSAVNQ
jgi:peptidyl-prolyl cis-trans isomerase D